MAKTNDDLTSAIKDQVEDARSALTELATAAEGATDVTAWAAALLDLGKTNRTTPRSASGS